MADAATLAQLRWEWEGDGGAPPAEFRTAFVEWYAGHEATHVPFVAVVDDRASGMAWLALSSRVPSVARHHRPSGEVQSVYVAPEWRNRGMGAALVAAVVAEARLRRLTHLTVHSAETAIPFYGRLGFASQVRWMEYQPPQA